MAKIKVEQIEDLHIPFKNAESFGFSPGNNGEDNVTALQGAIDGGGTIVVSDEGTYDINASIVVPAETTIIFGANVFIQKVLFNGSSPRYAFVNEGAFTKTTDSNIKILGLHLIANGIENGSDYTTEILGSRGHIFFHYVENFEIINYTLLDGGGDAFGMHICTFEDIKIINTHIEGQKDGIHIGTGNKFIIRRAILKTFDDPIALNGHAWISGQPEVGWIEDGIIEDVYDLNDATTTGFFTRMLGGAWVDWFGSMDIQRGDIIVASNTKMYRSNNIADGTVYTSLTEPTHASGTVTHDSIDWVMINDGTPFYTAGVRNITFRNVYLQKDRNTAFSFQFSTSNESRSYYPNATIPVQGGIVWDNILTTGTLNNNIVSANTPVSDIKIINSSLQKTNIFLEDIGIAGLVYPKTSVMLINNTYNEIGTNTLISSGYDVDIETLGSIVVDATYVPSYGTNVNVVNSDLPKSILNVVRNETGYTWTPNARTSAIFENNSSDSNIISVVGKAAGVSAIWLGDEDSQTVGRLSYDHSTNEMSFWTGGVSRATINSSGALITNEIGINTTPDNVELHVQAADTGYTWTPNTRTIALFEGTNNNDVVVSLIGKALGSSQLWFGDEDNENTGRIKFDHTTNALEFWTAFGKRAEILSNGNFVGTGTSEATGFQITSKTDVDVVLAGGGSKLLSDFVLSSDAVEFKATRKLSLGDILALNTTPLEVVAAQGVGTVVIVKSVNYEYTFLSAYATQTIIETKYSGQTPILSSIDILGGGADKIIGESGAGSERFENTAIEISVPTADPTGGTSTIDVYITYEVLTL